MAFLDRSSFIGGVPSGVSFSDKVTSAIPGAYSSTDDLRGDFASSLGMSSEDYNKYLSVRNYLDESYKQEVSDSISSAKVANDFAHDEAEIARKFNSEEAIAAWERSEQSAQSAYERQKQLLDYQNELNLKNRKTAYQDAVSDLKAAGLNPLFFLGNPQSVNSSASSVASGSSYAASSGAASASQAYSVNKKTDISSLFSTVISSSAKATSEISSSVIEESLEAFLPFLIQALSKIGKAKIGFV